MWYCLRRVRAFGFYLGTLLPQLQDRAMHAEQNLSNADRCKSVSYPVGGDYQSRKSALRLTSFSVEDGHRVLYGSIVWGRRRDESLLGCIDISRAREKEPFALDKNEQRLSDVEVEVNA